MGLSLCHLALQGLVVLCSLGISNNNSRVLFFALAAEESETTSTAEAGTCDASDGSCDKYGVTQSIITSCLATETETPPDHRPRYNETTFRRLREIYRVIEADYPEEVNPIAEEEEEGTGFVVPITVSTVPGTSYRGVFVTTPVPQGTRVWNPRHKGTFFAEEPWLAFLYAVRDADWSDSGHDDLGQRLACDILQWAYVIEENRYYPDWDEYDWDLDELSANVDLDEGSFVNHGWSSRNESTLFTYNVSLVPQDEPFCDMCEYASRDLQIGDEIRADYTKFCKFGKLEWFEASVAKAWNVDRSASGATVGGGEEPKWHYRA